MVQRLLRKRFAGIISSDLALSPLVILGYAVLVTLILCVIYYGLSYLFFSEIIMKGARTASVNPDVTYVKSAIYNGTVKVLPASQQGITLFSDNKISINTSDGDFVTVKATYTVMLPGVELFKSLGGRAANWTVPASSVFSFMREY